MSTGVPTREGTTTVLSHGERADFIARRMTLRLSQAELGNLAGVTASSICNIELGRRVLSKTLAAVINALNAAESGQTDAGKAIALLRARLDESERKREELEDDCELLKRRVEELELEILPLVRRINEREGRGLMARIFGD